MDAIAELREAVDFLRYYGVQALEGNTAEPCGLFACISPWNFPLAIFTGQIAAALAAGNGVLSKPAELTPLTASVAVRLLHEAGVPGTVLQLLPGSGPKVGARLTSDPRIDGICFTGSTRTAQTINRVMAKAIEPSAPLIAETGGINAMIVDSTALPEQAVKDIVASAFQSAGQRCSALRILYLQDEIATSFLEMLFGTMDELAIGDPWAFATDIGPVIGEQAQIMISEHINAASSDGRCLKQLKAPEAGSFIGPAVIKVEGINDLKKEIFGPVLHVATFQAPQIDDIIDDINASRYGLTFGLHTRIDDRVESLTDRLKVGNMYINRNQIGAIVGSQPFGGEGLSGSGPKAGGPHYLNRFRKTRQHSHPAERGPLLSLEEVQAAIDGIEQPAHVALETIDLPGPTGESNRLSLCPRGTVLCLGPSAGDAERQAGTARSAGCSALAVAPGVTGDGALSGFLDRTHLTKLRCFDAVALWSEPADLKAARQALAARDGPLVPLITAAEMTDRCLIERHVCIDTTAAGGNASLLSANA
jgi:RHH-type proline utilization regulon transcriptional repressor/proline dehydrogenase/delta 1-pyrroline-5-carboxylate dehydrogenase